MTGDIFMTKLINFFGYYPNVKTGKYSVLMLALCKKCAA
jgi:hypothetical protein